MKHNKKCTIDKEETISTSISHNQQQEHVKFLNLKCSFTYTLPVMNQAYPVSSNHVRREILKLLIIMKNKIIRGHKGKVRLSL